MATDTLNDGGVGCVAGGAAGSGLGAVWFEPVRRWALRSDPRVAGRIEIALLNRFAAERGLHTEEGLPLRFVDAGRAPVGAYELVIRDTGAVPTRVQGAGMFHDWFNALVWLAFPRIKARLNRLHSDAVAAAAGASANQGRRGALRDAATVFDESGALFVCRDASLRASLRRRDWHGLFVDGRARFADAATVCVVGHGVCEKLLSPYKALCAHAWIVELEPDLPTVQCGDALDAAVAAQLMPDALRTARLCPLPVLGVPGWWPANVAPAFYDDADVFRTGYRRCKITAGAGRAVAGRGAKAPQPEEGPDSTGQDAG